MPTIDVQVHAYERNHIARPWVGHLAGPTSVTGAEMVAAMDRVGVDGAILVSPFALFGAQPVVTALRRSPTVGLSELEANPCLRQTLAGNSVENRQRQEDEQRYFRRR